MDYDTISKLLEENYNITSTEITGSGIRTPVINSAQLYSPEIYANELSLKATTTDNGHFSLFGRDAMGVEHEVLSLGFWDSGTPQAIFTSPCGANAWWQFTKTQFASNSEIVFGNSTVDFSGTTVKGLETPGTTVAVFG